MLQDEASQRTEVENYCSLAYSALACFRMGMSGAAFPRVWEGLDKRINAPFYIFKDDHRLIGIRCSNFWKRTSERRLSNVGSLRTYAIPKERVSKARSSHVI